MLVASSMTCSPAIASCCTVNTANIAMPGQLDDSACRPHLCLVTIT